ncbi:hypothetical protein AMATHDRAFT_49769 [Amanita thiersii Skay4041]|uniref:Uncharacterized protein n=1 Tax=Amanita thiersii Skay4041 TaxID=703135 RepID=A0A2A9NAQ1_9AGAR|nr:hypothetical protein AMATHDRAFT_49769 [Amanita thiersii Skay4041]
MASPSFMRSRASGLPVRLHLKSISPRPILKRPSKPTPLPLSPSPFPFSQSFSVLFSNSPLSPHVHFPPSPSLFATFSTHSPNTYDRAPILVSPNQLELPAWGDRIYSPSIDGFRIADAPKGRRFAKPSTPLEDPRSPRQAINARFASTLANGTLPRAPLSKAVSTFPRSPYPSAPLTPVAPSKEENAKKDTKDNLATRGWPKRRSSVEGIDLAPPPRVKCADERSGRRSITLRLTSTRRPAPPQLNLSLSKPQPFSLSPVQELSDSNGQREGDLSAGSGESSRLSNAFWESVSIEEGIPSDGSGGFPESVFGSPEAVDLGLRSPLPAAPAILFGRSDGSVWSPGFPKRDSATSADQGKSEEGSLKRSTFTAPSPNDPLATFPSFSATMKRAGEHQMIKPPPRALLL